MHHFVRRLRLAAICGVVGLGLLGGCASVHDPRDPFEPLNRGIYQFNDGVDHLLLKPAAEIYQGVLPAPVRTGVSNVFSNLNDVIVSLNNLLQGKLNAALSDASRVLVNTTVGLLGIFDVATSAGLEKHDEDFGQTLGWWGVGDGPYLVLPFLGPSNARDTVGRVADYKLDPVTYIDPTSDRNAVQGLRLVSRRAELLSVSRILAVAALDEYEFVRDGYLQRRRNLIYDGNPPREKYEAADATSASGTAAHGVNRRDKQTAGGTVPAGDALPDPVAMHQTPATPQPVVRVWLSPR